MADNENDTEFRYYRGEGGVVWELELPLTPEMADQVRQGKLVEVPKPEDVGDDTPRRVAGNEPAPHEPKSVWVEWAIAHGMSHAEAQNLSRNDLVEKFATKSGDTRKATSGAETPGMDRDRDARQSSRANRASGTDK